MRASSHALALRFPGFVFRFSAVRLLGAFLWALLGVAADGGSAQGDINSDGNWMGPWHAGSRATHMTLLRRSLSTGADSSLVLYWHHSDTAQVLLYKLPDFQGSGPRTARASAAAMNIFCSGHSTLADGRLIVVSGTAQGENGDKRTKLFDPNFSSWPASGNNGSGLWAESDTFKYERWYPSVKTMANGKVFALSGFLYKPAVVVGGTKSGGSAPWLRSIGLKNYPSWSDGTTEDRVLPRTKSLSDHTSIMTEQQRPNGADVRGSIITFGGLDGSGVAQDTVWQTWHHPVDPFNNWESAPISITGSGPGARSQHGAVIQEHASSYAPLNSFQLKMFVFGGLDASGNALGNLWVFNRADNSASGTWSQPSTTGTPPSARYGHTCVYDPGPEDAPGVSHPRMLVFGGKTNATTWADNSVYQLSLEGPPYAWSTVATGGPSARYRHAAIFDAVDRATSVDLERRMVIFGGLGPDSLLSDTWQLERVGYGGYAWHQVANGLRPSPRYRHSLVQDQEWDRLIVFGGETDTSGTRTASTWKWSFYPTDSLSAWAELVLDGSVDATSGHAAVYYTQNENARIPEQYDPNAAAGSKWTQYSTAPKWDRDLYPFLFQLPSGRIFYAGKNDTSMVLDPAHPENGWTNWRAKTQLGGAGTSAVMYAPGKIMQAGNKNNASVTTTLTINYSLNEDSSWVELGPPRLFNRANHNLTILPTGDVLATGGHVTNKQSDPPMRRAQIWNPSTGGWTDSLASEPVRRGYHSTAVLLPDARVMCAGGDANDDSYYMTIYEPPYLFRSGTYASRPVISTAPDIVIWGESYPVCIDSTSGIGSMCLMRPGAATHAFNQNQMFIPLSFSGGGSSVTFTAPSDSNVAPPGDYLLFVVDNTSEKVPSVARWVHVQGYDRSDSARPTKITTLSAGDGDECVGVDFGWDSPRDDTLATKKVKGFDLRYRGTTICDNCWTAFGSSSQAQCEPAPGPPGAARGMTVTGLVAGSYYFRMVSYDDKNATEYMSPMSNAVSVQVYSCSGLLGGGGGGGGSLLSPGGEFAATVGEEGASAEAPESPLLPGVGLSGGTDYARFAVPPAQHDSTREVRLRQGATGESELRGLRLHALDVTPLADVFRARSRWLAGTRLPATSVHAADGADVSAMFAGDEHRCYVAEAGDTAVVTLTPSATPTPVYLRIRGRGTPGTGGIEVQGRSATGAWMTLTRFVPRGRFADVVLDSVAGAELRLVPEDNLAITNVGRVLEAAVAPVDRGSAPRALRHSRLGAVDLAALAPGGAGTTLAARDTVWSEFADVPEAPGLARLWYLEVTGSQDWPEMMAVARSAPEALQPAAAMPLRFALEQNRPNPFASETEIVFALPSAARVKLEVFDLAGRRMSSLLGRTLAPGRHVVRWDRRGQSGERLAAGVYVYRLTAGPLRAERKLVLFP